MSSYLALKITLSRESFGKNRHQLTYRVIGKRDYSELHFYEAWSSKV